MAKSDKSIACAILELRARANSNSNVNVIQRGTASIVSAFQLHHGQKVTVFVQQDGIESKKISDSKAPFPSILIQAMKDTREKGYDIYPVKIGNNGRYGIATRGKTESPTSEPVVFVAQEQRDRSKSSNTTATECQHHPVYGYDHEQLIEADRAMSA